MAIRKALVLITGVTSQIPGVDTLNAGSGVVSDGSNQLVLDSGGGSIQVAANRDLAALSGTGNFDWSSASGTFKTSTGAVTIGPGAVTVSGATTYTGAGTALTVNNASRFIGVIAADGGIGRSSAGTLSLGTDVNTTAITIGSASVTTTIAGPLSISGGVNANSITSGLTTTGLATGDTAYVSASNTVAKTDSAALATARFFGISEGVSGSITRAGVVTVNFTTVGGSPSNGAAVWLAAAADDSNTGAGKLTATPPNAGVSCEVGVCLDNGNYASAKTCRVLLQPKSVVVL